MHRICSSLADNGYDVLLVGRKLKNSLPLTERNFRQDRMNLLFRRGKLFYTEYNIRLFLFLIFQRFDIVCGIDLDTIVPCILHSWLRKKKCLYDAHEIFPEVPEVNSRPVTKRIWQWVEKFSVRRVTNCYTVSDGLREYFQYTYGRKFIVIRNVPRMIDHEPIAGAVTFESFILYQGALNEGRGLEQLIEAMQEVPLQLKLVGEGDLSHSLRTLANKKHLDHKVLFEGKKTPEELEQVTRMSFIGVNLLENRGLSYYHSLANKFFDYVQAGIPSINMNFPEYKKLNEQFEVSLLIDDLQTDTIVKAVDKLLHDKDYYFRLRKNCLLARKEWNWQKEELKLLSLYEQL